MVGDHAEYRPRGGDLALAEATQLISSGIAFAREEEVKKLMVVTLGLAGFLPPTVLDRYFFVRAWARAAGSSMRVAIVAAPAMIDPARFGVRVAISIGFASNVFDSEKEALVWL